MARQLFHKGHTNKIAATLGRSKSDPKADTETLVIVFNNFMRMLMEDNPEMDLDSFAVCFAEHVAKAGNTLDTARDVG